MKYWDSSAIVPFLVEEARTSRLLALLRADSVIVTWWGTEVECVSAVARMEREGKLDGHAAGVALRRLDDMQRRWHEIQPSEAVRQTAKRMLRVHVLRAADALHLAAATISSQHRPQALPFVCLDERLSAAAAKESFEVVD